MKDFTVQSLVLRDQRHAGQSRSASNAAPATAPAIAPMSTFESLPSETIFEILENLNPAQDAIDPVFVGSKALATAQENLYALQALCRVSKRMDWIARPYLWRVIVIPDPNKLICLHRSLMACPTFGHYVKSLAVHRNFKLRKPVEQTCPDEAESCGSWALNPPTHADEPEFCASRTMKLADFFPTHQDGGDSVRTISPNKLSQKLVKILQRTPCLIALSLIGVRMESVMRDPDELHLFSSFMARDISLAKNANPDREFLPKVEILGLLYCIETEVRAPATEHNPREYGALKGLLNLPSLRHVVFHKGGYPEDEWDDHYGDILAQRSQELRDTITTIDVRNSLEVTWETITEICSLFPCLSSLSTSTLKYFMVATPPAGVMRLDHMRFLRHLSIDVDLGMEIVGEGSERDCTWFAPSQLFNLSAVPQLETVRISLGYFRNYDTKDQMLCPSDVLPRTLKSLTLIADERSVPAWHDPHARMDRRAPEDSRSEDELHRTDGGRESSADDSILTEEDFGRTDDSVDRNEDDFGKHQDDDDPSPSVPWTIVFLKELDRLVDDTFPNLVEVTLENPVKFYDEPDMAGGDDDDSSSMNETTFPAQIEALEASFEKKGIQFRSIKKYWPPGYIDGDWEPLDVETLALLSEYQQRVISEGF